MRTTVFAIALLGLAGSAWAQKAKVQPKENPEVASVKKLFGEVMDAVDASWFGKPYQGVNSLDMSGSLQLSMSAASVNAKVEQASKGAVKGAVAKDGKASLQLRGTWLANGNFRCELGGDGGQILYTRIGNKGYIYSKDLNAFTDRVELPPSDAPLTYMGWFRKLVLETKSVYADSGTFKASFGSGDDKLQTIVFSSGTSAYDPKKREQSLDDSLDFWKRGRLEVTFDKATKLPHKALFSNSGQGVKATMTFAYGDGRRLQSVSFDNQSKGMEGPVSLKVSYGNDGLMKSVAGEMKAKTGRITWDLDMSWSGSKKLAYVPPPPGADKKGKEDLQALLYVNLAGQIMDLQRYGLNLRSVSLSR